MECQIDGILAALFLRNTLDDAGSLLEGKPKNPNYKIIINKLFG
ncbi:hypothetical protein RG963_07470 [Methanosarcina sp. Z-7115]|uniref:Uncharacterized protein n=1 Tax=Methanosarcina baikalica TaxID=3073890 RepID=A0ABU2D0V2_9EURY|nr:hypothetical protein [Methanosarcina sp. Z-7115]MDR7665617.1 hypothetical protein [Methanosarcina sp. Z-7115]